MGELTPELVEAPGLAVTVYCVIDSPPLLAGAVKLTTALPTLGIANTEVGAPGGPFGVTAREVPGGPVPSAFVAVTVNV